MSEKQQQAKGGGGGGGGGGGERKEGEDNMINVFRGLIDGKIRQPLKKRKCCIYHHNDDKDAIFLFDDGTKVSFSKASLMGYEFWDNFLFSNNGRKLSPPTPLETIPLIDRLPGEQIAIPEYPIVGGESVGFESYLEHVCCPEALKKFVHSIGDIPREQTFSNEHRLIKEFEKISKIMYYSKKYDTEFVMDEILIEMRRILQNLHPMGKNLYFLYFIISIAEHKTLEVEATDIVLLFLKKVKSENVVKDWQIKEIILAKNNPIIERVFARALFLSYGTAFYT